ncbi:MAG: hypothetical protein M1817_006088 [Caeruleum heppii]|nr:MAG: hypothetical protein M1817_006088 [Caeruleum heppii]
MSPPLPLLALPVSFLLLLSYIPTLTLSFDVAQQPWPHNLPPHAKYWPEYGPLHRRSPQALGFGQLLLGAKPAGVKKMGGDEGEKFWPEYWMFEGGPGSNGTRQEDTEDEVEHHSRRHLQHFRLTDEDEEQAGNANISIPDNMPNTFQAPLRLHSEDHTLEDGPDHAYTHPLLRRLPAAFRRSTPLSKRQFQCPSGSTDCSSIGRPNSCCSPAETCQIIPDVGSGDVGCCPEGQRCLGDLMDCNTGFTQCSDDLGGGCCIPGYADLVPAS